MKRLGIYTAVSLCIMVVIILVISGKIVPTLLAIVLIFIMRIVFTSPKGKRWWRTWYRVGLEFDRFFENQVKITNNKQQ